MLPLSVPLLIFITVDASDWTPMNSFPNLLINMKVCPACRHHQNASVASAAADHPSVSERVSHFPVYPQTLYTLASKARDALIFWKTPDNSIPALLKLGSTRWDYISQNLFLH
jgi:hypothetical protein